MEGYAADADLGLGCGLPTEFAKIKKGDTVVDLGSGAGNDCFVARAEAGESGRIIGVDFVDAMLMKARTNLNKLGYNNVSFVKGDIENIPLPEQTADVVVSNCVMNLVPNKQKAFGETHRILKTGGHFSISDIVIEGDLPDALKQDAEMYAGCVSGAIQLSDYLAIVEEAGFKNLVIQKKTAVNIPNEIVSKYLNGNELETFNKEQGIYSITLFAEK
jgi:ubiquinone/menaquinone biosynthesis C-methylase UbiE